MASCIGTSLVTTLKPSSRQGPNEVEIATSVASSTCHQNATDTRDVVAGIEGIPSVAEIDLEPGAEIHRCRIRWHPDVAEITGTIARRNIHASAQCDRKVGEVAAYTAPVGMRLPRRFGRTSVLIAKFDMVVHIITDCLNEGPPLAKLPNFAQAKFTS